MTECGALPDINDAELDAATSEHHWTCSPQATNRRPSHPTVGNNEAHPNPSQTHRAQPSKKSESKGGANGQPTPNTTQKPTRPSPPTAKPSRRVPKSRRTTMPARHQPPSQAPYRSQPPPSDHWYGGLGGSLGDLEPWKPQKVGGYRWTRCPQNSNSSHVAQDTARSWFGAVLTLQRTFRPFLTIFSAVLGHIVEPDGKKELFVTRQSRRMWSNRLPSFGRFQLVSGPFWAQKGCFGAQNVQLWEGTSQLGAHAPGRHR